MALYIPKEMLSRNTEVDWAEADAAFTSIFAPTTEKKFVWFYQYQVEQTTRKVTGWYGFTLSSSARSIFCPCGKPHTPQPKKLTISDNSFHGICDDNDDEKPKRNRTAISSIGCPLKLCVSHVTKKTRLPKRLQCLWRLHHMQSFSEQTNVDKTKDCNSSICNPPWSMSNNAVLDWRWTNSSSTS